MKRFAAIKYLSVGVAFAALGAAGTAPSFAQSRDHTGSMMPAYYDADGKQVTGSWAPPAAPQLYLSAQTKPSHHHRAKQGPR